jgi:DNA-binding transcriptional MerR regulator
MNQYFSIGETARLNNISIQTLRYYDKIGIFKPHYTDKHNGYRYYHIKQFFYLDVIKYLKDIRTPLEEIRHIISGTPEHMQTFLEEQERVIQQEMDKLEHARLLLQRRKDQLKEQLDINKKERGLVYFRDIEEQTILKVATPQVNPHDNPDLYVRKLADVLEEKECMVDNHYGCIYDLIPYKNSQNIYYNSIYTTISKDAVMGSIEKPLTLDTISPGEYICITFDWSPQHYYKYYQKLYSYIHSNDIQTEGKVYEVSLPNNYSSLKEESFITELRVLKK